MQYSMQLKFDVTDDKNSHCVNTTESGKYSKGKEKIVGTWVVVSKLLIINLL